MASTGGILVTNKVEVRETQSSPTAWDIFWRGAFPERGSAGPGPESRTTQLKAEIYKLVLYEEGTFLPHQDSEKADEIFGITNTPVQSSALLD
ncbi:hypothetical protein V8E54_015108 [Elaphomyces granulatus]